MEHIKVIKAIRRPWPRFRKRQKLISYDFHLYITLSNQFNMCHDFTKGSLPFLRQLNLKQTSVGLPLVRCSFKLPIKLYLYNMAGPQTVGLLAAFNCISC